MPDAVIVEAVRTPLGKRNGALKDTHPVDLLASTLNELVARAGIDPDVIEDNITGCVGQVGEQALNVGRNAWLAAGLPETVPSTTIDRQCGSSQQAAHFAAQAVMSGVHDVVVASGVEAMTRIPMGTSIAAGGWPFPESLTERYDPGLVPQGISSELVAANWDLTREDLDAYGLRSQERAAAAWDAGHFDREVFPIKVSNGEVTEFRRDEGLRDTSLEKLAGLRAAFYDEQMGERFPQIRWVTTAGNSSQITDGAAAMLVMSPEKAKELGLKPRARFHTMALAGTDPVTMLTGPIPATQKVLAKSGLNLHDIDVIEVNEAFASVVLAWKRELGVDDAYFDKNVNPNGGAIALGHPLGASGARIMITLLHEMERRGARYGLQTMCEGGGLANGTILERV